MERLVQVVELLRRHCPWTAALDHASLLTYLVEETYELYEAVDEVTRAREPSEEALAHLCGELGDVLFQVVLHARLQQESGTFGLADVAGTLTAKLVRRNPHVFAPDGSLREAFPASVKEIVDTWQQVKRAEHPARTSVFDGIPHGLPALALAAKTLQRAGEPRVSDLLPAGGSTADGSTDDEGVLGRELLDLVRRSLAAGVDPERALRRAVLIHRDELEGPAEPSSTGT
ncbi:MazG nucleotide pyrophosphohydrolase domain-containing protein [Arthrobacter sp. RIT-PI-e]|uniref:MazG nucleotide pyrophosphohydrolase domain-containing protein n=1 Tax=Arthrobacter sp. RIT-PI-e TaxID=1681197 RepID=UPI001F1E4247|nr:MazG nucleotide pyrophosphohydrolase domain-containing protein [Arthrobacter sp. RIT-PI-e]